ncbi:MAG: GT4 family glycosyltransferase PelF [Acidobacteriota bacterium]|nr:GT4 family glycosyltransferase PelF [Blastocatellia bacterium]MDW8412701.1 GT4 family glycosyltransferase PelF [Acidobacteriota bacterium]
MNLSVLLATEGTYPFHGGGVSTWCDTLIRNLSEYDFVLLSVMMHPYLKTQYQLPDNVKAHIKVPLWGIESPSEFGENLADRATEQVIKSDFVPLFSHFLQEICSKEDCAKSVAKLIVAMYDYFRVYDYQDTFSSKAVWIAFQNFFRKQPVSLAELVEALRLLYRFFIVLLVELPRTDITHSAAAAFCGLPCVIARIKCGTPYLLTEHGVYLREQYLNLRKHIKSVWVRAFLCRLIKAVVQVNYYCADQISPVCRFNKRWELWHGADVAKLKVIYNGVDPEKFKPASVESDRPIVANVGLIFPLKGQLDLIEAASIVRKRHNDVKFRFYGYPSDLDYYRRCVRRVQELSLEDVVKFAGKTTEPWKVYNEAAVVAFASVSEGFPYVVIEAMSCGAACVATDVGGVSEALKGCGMLVKPRRADQMAEAISYLLDRPDLRRKLGLAARQRVLELFTQQKFLQLYRQSYLSLARRG